MSEHEWADAIRRNLAEGEHPEDINRGLYQVALGWAHDAGAVDAREYAKACVDRIWALSKVTQTP